MNNQLEIATAPGWLQRMWVKRQPWPFTVFCGEVVVGGAATEQAALEMLANLDEMMEA